MGKPDNNPAELLTSFLKKDDSVLDLISMTGQASAYFLSKGFQVTALDYEPERLEVAKVVAPGADFYVRDVFSPLGLNKKFDGIYGRGLMMGVSKSDAEEVMKNIIDAMNTGGYIYLDSVNPALGGSIMKYTNYSLDDLKDLVSKAGLKIIYENVTKQGREWVRVIAQK